MIDSKLNSSIHKVVYINLDKRKDRRLQVESELQIFLPSKVQRFSAIEENPGFIGCTKSHIAVLQMAIREQWPNVLIVEDDLQFRNIDKALPVLQKLLDLSDWKVICLGAAQKKMGAPGSHRLLEGQTTVAYLVKEEQYPTLLANFEEGLVNLQKTKQGHFCIDQHWKILQKKDPWQVVEPCLVVQRPSQSDIEKKNTDQTKAY